MGFSLEIALKDPDIIVAECNLCSFQNQPQYF